MDDVLSEAMAGAAAKAVADAYRTILCYVDPTAIDSDTGATREGLSETPQRAAKAMQAWTEGYAIDPHELLKTFEDGAENYDEMVVVRDLPFYSTCEHHLAPFFGTATIAYVPKGRVVGLSKLGRVLDAYSRRLQVQERMTQQIAAAINKVLEPRGVAVIATARHLCMESRGIRKQGHTTVTSALTGVFREDRAARAELLGLASL